MFLCDLGRQMSIADFLLTPAQQRILGPLLLNPGRKFKLIELLRLSGPGRGAGQLQVAKLIRAGVLTEEHLGNQRHIRINERFPLYPELRSICLKSFGLKEKLMEVLRPVASQLHEAFVFGSVARGDDRADSDIDLMVVGCIDLISLMDVVVPAEQDVGRPIHVNLYDPEEWELLKQTDTVIARIAEGQMLRILPVGSALESGKPMFPADL
jgi:uncharacterized protein